MQVLESHYGSLDARHLGCLRAIQWEGEWDVGVINGMSGSYICSDSLKYKNYFTSLLQKKRAHTASKSACDGGQAQGILIG
jgi:hypothetical protein